MASASCRSCGCLRIEALEGNQADFLGCALDQSPPARNKVRSREPVSWRILIRSRSSDPSRTCPSSNHVRVTHLIDSTEFPAQARVRGLIRFGFKAPSERQLPCRRDPQTDRPAEVRPDAGLARTGPLSLTRRGRRFVPRTCFSENLVPSGLELSATTEDILRPCALC